MFLASLLLTIQMVASQETSYIPPADAKVQIIRMSLGHILARALYVAAKLKIADLITTEPIAIEELAVQTGCQHRALYRLMRMLASHGIFYESSHGYFISTKLGNCLRSTGADSIAKVILGEDTERWNAIGNLEYSVKSGNPSFNLLYEKSYFEYIATDPDKSAQFDAHMAHLTLQEDQLLADALNLAHAHTIVDIGGGRGNFLKQLLLRNPSAQGILFDTSAVIENRSALLIHEVADRCQVVAGSFFDRCPSTGDTYLLKRVLHDWDDVTCGRILQNIRKQMRKQDVLYVIEMLVPEDNTEHLSKDIDLLLMAIFAGQERTMREFSNLFATQGLSISNIQTTATGLAIIKVVHSYE